MGHTYKVTDKELQTNVAAVVVDLDLTDALSQNKIRTRQQCTVT